MDVRQMRQVLAIGRLGSFSKAAEELGLSQPALSKSIARLEDELGIKLFDRSGWRAQLTPMAQYLLSQVSPLVDEVHRVERHLRLLAHGDVGEVRIGLGPGLRPRFMPKLAALILSRHPNLKLTIMSSDGAELLRGVKAGDFDVVLLAHRTVEGAPDLVIHEVMEEPAVAVAAPGHPLDGKLDVTLPEFAAFPTTGSAISMHATPALYVMPELSDPSLALKPFSPSLVTNDLETTLEVVRQGLAVYAGPDHVVRPSVEAGELVQLNIKLSSSYRAVAAMTPGANLSPILQNIVGYAREIGDVLVSAHRCPGEKFW